MSAMQVVICLALGLLVRDSHAAGGSTPWTYTGQHGPLHWGSMFESCAGNRQSPINIETLNVKQEYWKPLQLKNYEVPPSRMRVKNNGHSAQVEMDASVAPRVSGGGLKGEYIFAQFHFHWGSDSTMGSEHTIDGVRYPMELHLVHYKGSYGTLAEAVKRRDGLAVLGVMLEVSNNDNPALAPLATALRNITQSGMFADVSALYPLKAFLPRNVDRFYRYDGSLTTPTCNEVVTWTVFDEAISISEKQLNSFRALVDDHGAMIVDNFRPPQPLNNRKVYVSADSSADSSSLKKVGLTVYFMTTMAVLMMNM